MEEVNKSADACKYSAEKVCTELCSLYVDAEHICALAVAADGIEVSSELCPFKKHKQNDNCDKRNYNAYLNISRYINALFVVSAHKRNYDTSGFESLEFFICNIELGCVYDGSHTLCKEHSHKSNYKGLYLKICDKISLNKSESKSDSKGN